jgi:sodium-dependent phosphate transporter
MALTQFNYLFAIGTIFSFLDAWNIGANDVANAWATSVASRSLPYVAAMSVAAVMEFSGAVGVGARVADTIRTGIVDTTQFADSPAVLMLGMVCAVIASSLYLTFATKVGLPVSTTHSLMGGVIGFGVAALGGGGVKWVVEGEGASVISGGVVQVCLPCRPGVAEGWWEGWAHHVRFSWRGSLRLSLQVSLRRRYSSLPSTPCSSARTPSSGA